MIVVQAEDRWQVYRRLQELEIDCSCRAHQPLYVQVNTPYQLLQVWATLQRIDGTRSRLIERLRLCWLLPTALETKPIDPG